MEPAVKVVLPEFFAQKITAQPLGSERLQRVNLIIAEAALQEESLPETSKFFKEFGKVIREKGLPAGSKETFLRDVRLVNYLYRFTNTSSNDQEKLLQELRLEDLQAFGLECSWEEFVKGMLEADKKLAEKVIQSGSLLPKQKKPRTPRQEKVLVLEKEPTASHATKEDVAQENELDELRTRLAEMQQANEESTTQLELLQKQVAELSEHPDAVRKQELNETIGYFHRIVTQYKTQLRIIQEGFQKEQDRSHGLRIERDRLKASIQGQERHLLKLTTFLLDKITAEEVKALREVIKYLLNGYAAVLPKREEKPKEVLVAKFSEAEKKMFPRYSSHYKMKIRQYPDRFWKDLARLSVGEREGVRQRIDMLARLGPDVSVLKNEHLTCSIGGYPNDCYRCLALKRPAGQTQVWFMWKKEEGKKFIQILGLYFEEPTEQGK